MGRCVHHHWLSEKWESKDEKSRHLTFKGEKKNSSSFLPSPNPMIKLDPCLFHIYRECRLVLFAVSIWPDIFCEYTFNHIFSFLKDWSSRNWILKFHIVMWSNHCLLSHVTPSVHSWYFRILLSPNIYLTLPLQNEEHQKLFLMKFLTSDHRDDNPGLFTTGSISHEPTQPRIHVWCAAVSLFFFVCLFYLSQVQHQVLLIEAIAAKFKEKLCGKLERKCSRLKHFRFSTRWIELPDTSG